MASLRSTLLVFFVCGLVVVKGVRADEILIRETEALRSSLALSDPSRLPLTLRLADFLMDEATRSIEKSNFQARALALYDEALKEKIEGPARIKINFQRARLMSDLGQVDSSVPLWKSLAEQKELPEISREAALRLAESGDVKNAQRWFEQALQLCSGGDICSYIRFKRAWLFRQSARSGLADDRAISERWSSLFGIQQEEFGEEALRDYLVFLGERPGLEESDVRSSLEKVESLAQRLDRPSLIADLAEAYFAAGNKMGGAFVLAQAQRKDPKFVRLVRLAEEQYGARDWNGFSVSLEALSGEIGAKLFQGAILAEQVEAEKVLRRLIIQLDGERISQKARTPDFQKASRIYLSRYPNSPEKLKFQEGWLVAEEDSQKKLNQLGEWIQTEPNSFRLREIRAGIAQKIGLSAVLMEDLGALAGATNQSAKTREYLYLLARAHYEAKDFEKALSLFQRLARVEQLGSTPDQWAIQSQNLALDILNQQKNWNLLIAQASSWVDSPWSKSASSSLQKELHDMTEIRKQAQFEKVVSQGETVAALKQFLEFCRQGLYAEKSCENARVLSVKLKQQESLLEVLQKMGPSRQLELAQELEASGYFGRAAAVLEKVSPLGKEKDPAMALKIVLLWELSLDDGSFARVVSSIQQLQLGLNEKQEALWLSMAMDVAQKSPQVLTAGSFKFLKSDSSRERLAEWLEGHGGGSAESRQVLVKAAFQTGPAWAKWVQSEIESGVKTAQAISFYGRQSRSKFEKRLAAMVGVSKRADQFFPRCEPPTKAVIAGILKKAFEEFASEIRNSPIPQGLPESSIPELKAGLEEMAKPFDEKAKVYAQAMISPSVEGGSDRLTISVAHPQTVVMGPTSVEHALKRLNQDPDSQEALGTLRDAYRALGKNRLSSYFEGRFNSTGGGK